MKECDKRKSQNMKNNFTPLQRTHLRTSDVEA